jgi:hypothetical protein
MSVLRGQVVYDRGAFPAGPIGATLLGRGEAAA